MRRSDSYICVPVKRSNCASAWLTARSILEHTADAVVVVANGLGPREWEWLTGAVAPESRVELLDFPTRRELPTLFLLQRLGLMCNASTFAWALPGALRAPGTVRTTASSCVEVSSDMELPITARVPVALLRQLWGAGRVGLDVSLQVPEGGDSQRSWLAEAERAGFEITASAQHFIFVGPKSQEKMAEQAWYSRFIKQNQYTGLDDAARRSAWEAANHWLVTQI